jgi:WD40 repeat protein
VQFWDAATGQETARVVVRGGFGVAAVVFAPDGSLAAASAGEGVIQLFEPATGAARGVFLGRARQGRRLAFSPDGKTLASAGDDGAIQRWSVADGKRLDTTEPPVPVPHGVRGLVYAAPERVLAWTTRGVAVQLWEAPSGKLLTPPGGHTASVESAAFAAGGKEILTVALDGAILRWDAATGKELGAIRLRPPGAGGLAFSSSAILAPTGARALAVESGGIGVYDLPAGTQAFLIPGRFNHESRGSFSADGTKIVQVLGTYDARKNPARVVVWDVAAARKLGEVMLPGVGFPTAVVTPDGKTLVTSGVRQDEEGGTATYAVTGWELASGKKLGDYTEASGYGSGFLAAAADNRSVVAVLPKGVALIDTTTGKKTRDLETGGRGQPSAAPAVSPDGQTAAIVFGSGYGPNPIGTLVLVDLATGKARKTLTGITGNPSLVHFALDGKTLVTGSSDTTALVWEVAK